KNYSLTLNLGVTALVNFKLSPVGATDVVEVTARMNLGKTESSTNTTRERIDSLPINQRNFLDFATTAPRVVPDRLPNTGVGATTG
ncbi:MAG: hypothetical protein JNN15_04280, partial [Blastocatellia bacterium]|nr:hypothetical protein [Blastocatellia bacterium]